MEDGDEAFAKIHIECTNVLVQCASSVFFLNRLHILKASLVPITDLYRYAPALALQLF